MNRLVNGTFAVFFTAIAAGILSCEIPTDGSFGGAIRGTSEARPLLSLSGGRTWTPGMRD